MKQGRRFLAIGFVFSLFIIVSAAECGEDALVLPKGVFRVTLDGYFYLPIQKRYNPDGKIEDAATDFNTRLNSNIFPALAPLDPFVPGLPSIGDSHVSFKYDVNILETNLQYGVTDRISIGVKIPYWWVANHVKAQVDSGPGSSANVGKNPCFGVAGCPLGSTTPLVPIAFGGIRLSTEDVQGLLGKGLDINGDGRVDIPGFGYKRFQTWDGNGLSDVEAGFRYQYLKSEDFRLAFTGGVRFPTGRVDDIDNLVDSAFGTGAYAILYRFNNDYVLSSLWRKAPTTPGEGGFVPGAGDIVLNSTFGYDLVLPDSIKKRLSTDPNNPVATQKEIVKRNLGDYIFVDSSAKFGLMDGLYLTGTYRYGYKNKDTVKASFGHVGGLEGETRTNEHVLMAGLSYSTLPLYMQKKFLLPITASITYRNRFAGSNNVFRSQYLDLGLQFFF